MKLSLVAVALLILSAGCNQQNEKTRNYVPRVLTQNEVFNDFPKDASDSISVVKISEPGEEPVLVVKFRDSTVHIQDKMTDTGGGLYKFKSSGVQFTNKQKTCLLVELADSSGLTPRPFLIATHNGKLEVISLYRPSNGKDDKKYTTGINKMGATGYLVNNDFFITNVTSKAYVIKRQHPDERIQGQVLLLTPDKQTIIFAVKDFLYQVHYRTNEDLNEPIAPGSPKEMGAVYKWITANYSFRKNKNGVTFLRYNDDNRIVDMRRK
ncbi:hypothetical protein TH53_10105 [Pedobacter lusitanus]|uniref:Lipoprotein n=1 Tax=Pedobacter lusitanus TaxID=1503925 RepID=A0A0D0F6R6_9SPHI|nr:hypothetical protein [Pedobacter lusitanus]KIO77288.1 hypothetical protein TH53_10105 [Pedobacter lusitanus]